MARIVRPSPEHHQDHLRNLIDQRAARANLPGPLPDTPSVYSPSIAVFSPFSPSDPPTARYQPSSSSYSSMPPSSMLDLEDDTRTSTYSATFHSVESLHDTELDDDDDDADGLSNRMSILGPKMRFHSRAPWETGEDVLLEEDEVPSPTYEGAIAVSEPSSRLPNIEGLKKGFRFGAPKPARGSEDSEDSSPSQGKYKRSFETASSRTSDASHFVNLAQSETPSSMVPPSPHSIFRYKSSGAKNLNTPPITPTASTPSSEISPSADHLRFSTESPVPWISAERRPSTSTLPLPSNRGYKEVTHPYANPDLVITAAEDPLLTASDLTDYTYSNGSRSEGRITTIKGNTGSPMKSANTFNLTPTSSTSSIREPSHERLRSRASNIHGKDISSPLPVHSAAGHPEPRKAEVKHPDVNSLPGWYNTTAPSFNLISLEEARAQRSRSLTANAVASQAVESPIRTMFPPGDPSGSENNRPAPRNRSTSAGVRPKILTDISSLPDPQQSSPHTHRSGGGPQQTLKHKKSGFMRIFGSKDRPKTSPPPTPTALDDHVANAQPRPSDLSKLSLRVPVPSISPVDTPPCADSSLQSQSSTGNEHLAPVASPQKASPVGRRMFPSTLSINTTSSPSQSSRMTSSASSDQRFSSWVATPPTSDVDVIPQSAPAHVADFPSLKLRPVSTMFSAHFRDHLISAESESEEQETQSPSSSMQGTRPVTPGSFSRFDSTSFGSAEDPASVIQALQNQIVSVRKAWQLDIWDLEGQVKDLKAQMEDMRVSEKEYCQTCGRGRRSIDTSREGVKAHGVVNRPRARTGTPGRFVNGS